MVLFWKKPDTSQSRATITGNELLEKFLQSDEELMTIIVSEDGSCVCGDWVGAVVSVSGTSEEWPPSSMPSKTVCSTKAVNTASRPTPPRIESKQNSAPNSPWSQWKNVEKQDRLVRPRSLRQTPPQNGNRNSQRYTTLQDVPKRAVLSMRHCQNARPPSRCSTTKTSSTPIRHA